MFNLIKSVRPIAVLDKPAFFKGNTYQIAIASTVPLTDTDVPLIAAILSPLESNQQKVITEVFKGYQELTTADQEATVLNVGGLGWVSDHYRLNTTGNEKNEEYQDAMGFALIPAELLGETGEARYPDIVLFADTLEVTTSDNLQSYFSAECAYLIVEQSVNGQGNSYKLQSRGPVVGEDDTTNPRFYVSGNKTILRQLGQFDPGITVQGAFAGNIGGYIGKDGTLKIRFSMSRFFKGKTYSSQGGVQRETMRPAKVGQATVNPAVAALRSRMPKNTTEVVADDY